MLFLKKAYCLCSFKVDISFLGLNLNLPLLKFCFVCVCIGTMPNTSMAIIILDIFY